MADIIERLEAQEAAGSEGWVVSIVNAADTALPHLVRAGCAMLYALRNRTSYSFAILTIIRSYS